jgi:hydroxymethylglutaryl-CoA reductase
MEHAPPRHTRPELVVVAGVSLDDRNDALAALRTQLLLGGPLVLLLASLAGYVLAAATRTAATQSRLTCRAAARS